MFDGQLNALPLLELVRRRDNGVTPNDVLTGNMQIYPGRKEGGGGN